MKRKALKPIVAKDAWARYFQTRIAEVIAAIFEPLADVATPDSKDNAKGSALIEALRRGDLCYRFGAFQGRFSAAISKEIKDLGGVFRYGAWFVSADRLPPSVLLAATRAENVLRRMQERIEENARLVAQRAPQYVDGLDFADVFDRIESGIEKGFRETVTKAIGVAPNITADMSKRLRDEYAENVRLSIKGFAADDATALRDGVQDLVCTGAPRARVVDYIRAKLRVALGRARFIARQETSLYTSKLKETQYRGAKINEYRWSTVGDNRVRPRHKHLNNKVFTWDNPPVIDETTGKRGHPGEDFNCRCQAIPLVTKL